MSRRGQCTITPSKSNSRYAHETFKLPAIIDTSKLMESFQSLQAINDSLRNQIKYSLTVYFTESQNDERFKCI